MTTPDSTTLRSSKNYFFEVLFVTNPGGDGFLMNPIPVSLANIKRETKTATNRPVLYTISLSDFVMDHQDAWDEKDRELIVLGCNEITQGRTRFMTMIGSDSGIGLFGSNAIVLQSLPDIIRIQLGFINLLDASDPTIYNCNDDKTISADGGLSITLKSQKIRYCIFRFAVSCSYL